MKNLSIATLILTVIFCATTIFADTHVCPSIASIKQRITDKNIVEFKYSRHDGFGWSNRQSSNGIINFFDSFDTTETWVFHFEVSNIWTQDELWNLFQKYLDGQPSVTRVASSGIDWDVGQSDPAYGFWVCRYTPIHTPADYGLGSFYYNVFAILKAP